MAARLNDLYKNEVAPALMKKFEYKSVMQIPKIDKVVINVGADYMALITSAWKHWQLRPV